MNHPASHEHSRQAAFTVIELLAVVAIIVALVSLIFPVTGVLKKKQMIAVAQAELKQVETAIETYKARLGFYPPDNPGNPVTNQLYFELAGTFFTNGVYQTLDGSGRMAAADLEFYGRDALNNLKVSGFANSSISARGSDERPAATSFLKNLRPNQVGQLVVNGQTGNVILICSVRWENPEQQLIPSPPAIQKGLSPWQYVSSNPTNNPGSFDLWVDLLIGGKTNRISNWSKQPQRVP